MKNFNLTPDCVLSVLQTQGNKTRGNQFWYWINHCLNMQGRMVMTILWMHGVHLWLYVLSISDYAMSAGLYSRRTNSGSSSHQTLKGQANTFCKAHRIKYSLTLTQHTQTCIQSFPFKSKAINWPGQCIMKHQHCHSLTLMVPSVSCTELRICWACLPRQ